MGLAPVPADLGVIAFLEHQERVQQMIRRGLYEAMRRDLEKN